MGAIDTLYSGFRSYGNKPANRYDTHRRSELRQVYNSMVKLNTESPIYQLREKEDSKAFILNMKEQSRDVQNVVSSLTNSDEGIDQTFRQRVAVSSRPDLVGVQYLSHTHDPDDEGFSIQVEQLATPQINLGKYLNGNGKNFSPGEYSFDLETTSNSYEFQFIVDSSDHNLDVQNKIASLINRANIGLSASVIAGDNNRHALRIESKQVGLDKGSDVQFLITHGDSVPSENAMVTLGIDHIASPAENSVFTINNSSYSSYGNTCTINQKFELHFYGITPEDEPVEIGFKPDSDAIIDHIQELVDSYNGLAGLAFEYSKNETGNDCLLRALEQVVSTQEDSLEPIGLHFQKDGKLEIDPALLTAAILNVDHKELYDSLTTFADSIQDKANDISLDPVRYVNHVVLFYKDPRHAATYPYLTSIYAGMYFDYQC